MNNIEVELPLHIRSGQAAFYVNSIEEARFIDTVREIGWRMAGPKLYASALEHTTNLPVTDIFKKCKLLNSSGEAKTDEVISKLKLMQLSDDADEHVVVSLTKILDTAGYATATWNIVSGLSGTNALADLLELIRTASATGDSVIPPRCLLVLLDAGSLLNGERISYRRAFRNCMEMNMLTAGQPAFDRRLIFLQPYMRPHEDIKHCLVRLEFPLPDDTAIAKIVDEFGSNQGNTCPPELRSELITALRGMGTISIETVLSYCLIKFGGFVPKKTIDGRTVELAATVRGLRSKQLSVGQGMRIIEPADPEIAELGQLGGYENLVALANRVNFCRTPTAKALGLKPPSGFAVAGPPGTGKTICAKLFAKWVGLPLCLVNLGALKGGIVGESESNTAAAIQTIKALGECVVLFDEWDKQAGGITGNVSDGNTSLGMLSLILEFASDPSREAFLIFTMNRLHGPIESLRAGRISRFLYTPMPDANERLQILKIKLQEAGAVIPTNLAEIADDSITDGLVGAELTEMVNEAIAIAAEERGTKDPTIADLRVARKLITPVSKLNQEEIAAMADFKNKAVSVNSSETGKRLESTVGRRKLNFNPNNN